MFFFSNKNKDKLCICCKLQPLKKIYWYLKIISTRVCKKTFWLKQKKICTGCPKIYDQNLHFWIFSKNSFRNELKAPFLLNFDTNDLTCKNFHFGRRGAPGGPRTLKKNLWYLKIISTRVCKRIFLIKPKKENCTGCHKI